MQQINKCVTAVKVSKFSGHYLRNRSTWEIGVLGYIGIVQHKEHSPEVFSIPLGTPCIKQITFILQKVKIYGHRPCFKLLYAATGNFYPQTAAHNSIIQ